MLQTNPVTFVILFIQNLYQGKYMCNAGIIERVLRVVLGVGLIAWGYTYQNWLGAIGIIPLLTGLIGICPIYTLLGINTGCKKRDMQE